MNRTIMCAVSALALFVSSPRQAPAGFRGTVLTNEPVVLEFAAVDGAPGETISAVTLTELGEGRVREMLDLSLALNDVITVQVMPSKNTRRIVIDVDVAPGAYTRVRVLQLGVDLVPGEVVGEDTRYVLDVR